MRKRGFFIAGLIAGFIFLTQDSGICAPTAEQWGAIMNISGRQRMLSQKMSKETLLLAAGINAEENRGKLKETMKLFETSLNALMNGDAAMNIPACEFPGISEQLEKVQTFYNEMDAVFDKAVEGGVPDNFDMQQIAKASLPLLTAADKAVQMFEAEAKKVLTKDPALALVINVAGRQRMISQKMAKEALLIYLKIDPANQAEALKKSIVLFENSLKGLKFGDSETGLPPTKSEEILGQLDVVNTFWATLKPLLDKISGQFLLYAVTKEEISSVSELTGLLLKESDKAVGMYEKLAK